MDSPYATAEVPMVRGCCAGPIDIWRALVATTGMGKDLRLRMGKTRVVVIVRIMAKVNPPRNVKSRESAPDLRGAVIQPVESRLPCRCRLPVPRESLPCGAVQ